MFVMTYYVYVQFLFPKVMTQNPEFATLETTILEALHIMHDGKFLHLPVVDKGDYCYLIEKCEYTAFKSITLFSWQMEALLPV